ISSVIVHLHLLSAESRYSSRLHARIDPCRDSPRSPYPRDLVALGVAGRPVADVEQDGENHPEPIEAYEADAGGVDDNVDQGRKREEDDAKQRQEKGVERRSDEGRSGDPEYEQREPREKSPKQREQTTHPHCLLSGLAPSTTAGLLCAGRRSSRPRCRRVAIHRSMPSVRFLVYSRPA